MSRVLERLDKVSAELEIARGRIRWYEDAFALIRRVIDEGGPLLFVVRDIKRVVGGSPNESNAQEETKK